MSTTTTATTASPKTITLSNGKTLTFNSNAASKEESIPIIDVSRMYSDKLEDRQALAEEIRTAAHEIGFLSIVNHVSETRLTSLSISIASPQNSYYYYTYL